MVVKCGICNRWFHFKSEITTEARLVKEYPHETHYICKKDKEQKQLEVEIRELRKQSQEKETSTKAKEQQKNLRKLYESTKKENNK